MNWLWRILFSLIFCLIPSLGSAKPAQLKNRDVRTLMERMMKEHAEYKTFNAPLARRALISFIEYLDPFKTYLTAQEVGEYLEPSEELLNVVVADYAADKTTVFERIHNLMIEAIERRGRFERALRKMPSLSLHEIDPLDANELTFAANLKELVSRLADVRRLQVQSRIKLEKIDPDLAKHFPKHLEKNRIHFEKEIAGIDLKSRRFALLTAVVKAYACALDSQTAYLTPTESKHFIMGMQKKLVGIGAVLRDDLEGLRITELLKGGPAERAQLLEVGDRIIAVDALPIAGMHIVDSVELIRGERGTEVSLTLVRDELVKEVKIKRDEIVFHEARTKSEQLPFADGYIAHIRLQTFYHDSDSSTAKEIENALKSAQKNGNLKGVILDMRGNPGGLLSEAIATAGLFMDRGVVASLKSSDGSVQHLRSLGWEPAYRGPLVVLVDAFSASSSEIVAGALQDYGRALVLGERTFGKGTFQLCTIAQGGKVSSFGEYKVTSGIYYTASGRSPQLEGIVPDISIQWIHHDFKVGERFGKYPLPGGRIAPSFEDDLADVPIMQRARIRALYRLGRQEKSVHIREHLGQLVENSKKRLAQNSCYQSALKSKERNLPEGLDFQLDEAVAVTKDLIALSTGIK